MDFPRNYYYFSYQYKFSIACSVNRSKVSITENYSDSCRQTYICSQSINFMLELKAVLLVCLVLCWAQCTRKVVEQQARSPVTDRRLLQDHYPQLLLGQDLRINYSEVYSQFEYKILRRKSATWSNIVEDYGLHNENYEETDLCRMEESNFNIEVGAGYKFTNTLIKAFEIDTARKSVYLLTESSEILVLGYEEAPQGLQFNKLYYKLVDMTALNYTVTSIHFESVNHRRVYVLTNQNLYEIDPDEPTPKLNLVTGLSSNLDSVQPIWQDQFLVLNHRTEIQIYQIENPKQLKLIQKIDKFQNMKLIIVDVWIEPGELWLLDEDFGIYYYVRPQNVYVEEQSYRIRYGQKLFFRRYGFTFEVAFEMKKSIYIAQLNLYDGDLILNRFYTQVPGVKEILFLNQLMMVVGDQQAMLIQHSISLTNLKHYLVKEGSWQKKQFTNTYGVRDIKAFDIPDLSSKQNGFLMAITDTSLEVHILKRNYAILRCHFNETKDIGKHSLYVSLNATTCRPDSIQVSIGNFCMIEHSLYFEVLSPTTKAESVLISYALLGGTTFLALIVCACILRYRAKKKHQVTELRGVLKRKMEEFMYHKPGTEALAL